MSWYAQAAVLQCVLTCTGRRKVVPGVEACALDLCRGGGIAFWAHDVTHSAPWVGCHRSTCTLDLCAIPARWLYAARACKKHAPKHCGTGMGRGRAVSLHVCQGDAGMVAVHSTGGVETALELCITDAVTGYAVSTDVYT